MSTAGYGRLGTISTLSVHIADEGGEVAVVAAFLKAPSASIHYPLFVRVVHH